MIEIGKTNRLTAARRAPPGVYLAQGDQEVLLPNRFVPKELELGAELDVFVYTDSSDRPVATTQTPLAQVGEFACLSVVDVTPHGAFLDWGLDKDLFAPLPEQQSRLRTGDRVVVAVCLDEHTGRVMASSRLAQFLEPPEPAPAPGTPAELLVYRVTELGAQVIVDDRHAGLVYASDTYAPLAVGDRVTGYVQRVRDDGKLDISLRAPGAAGRDEDTRALLGALEAAGGHLPLHDDSPPEEISARLGMSKKAFKRAVGNLYRQRLVRLAPDGIRSLARASEAAPAEAATARPSTARPSTARPSTARPSTARPSTAPPTREEGAPHPGVKRRGAGSAGPAKGRPPRRG